MSQVGKPIEKVTVTPKVNPVPEKHPAPTPVVTPEPEKVPA